MLESKRRAIIFLSLSILLAAIAGFMFLQKVKALNTELGEMAKVYVAADSITSRSVIQPNQVKAVKIPKKYINQSYITNKRNLAHKVSLVSLSEGDIITDNMLKPVIKLRDANHRLVMMYESDRIQFDQPLKHHDRVDIIVNQSTGGKPKTKIFMTDVKVAGTVKNKKNGVAGIALEVPYDQVPALIHVETYADSIRVLKANVARRSEANRSEQETQSPEDEENNQKGNNPKAKNQSNKEKNNSKHQSNMKKQSKKK